MNTGNERTVDLATQDDVIEFGAASIETKGLPPVGDEGQGRNAGVGITE